MLGIELKVDQLCFKPCFPLAWPSVTISYGYGASTYQVTVFQQESTAGSRWEMEDRSGKGNCLPLTDDGKEHAARVYIGTETI